MNTQHTLPPSSPMGLLRYIIIHSVTSSYMVSHHHTQLHIIIVLRVYFATCMSYEDLHALYSTVCPVKEYRS
jgi:hypothetical protein